MTLGAFQIIRRGSATPRFYRSYRYRDGRLEFGINSIVVIISTYGFRFAEKFSRGGFYGANWLLSCASSHST